MSTESEPFCWDHFLQVASELAASDNEAILRTSVSRAYYAGYHSAKLYLESKNYELRGTDHDKVWKAFEGYGKPREYGRVYNFGTRLKRARVSADYYLTAVQWQEQSKTSLADTKALLELVAALRQKG